MDRKFALALLAGLLLFSTFVCGADDNYVSGKLLKEVYQSAMKLLKSEPSQISKKLSELMEKSAVLPNSKRLPALFREGPTLPPSDDEIFDVLLRVKPFFSNDEDCASFWNLAYLVGGNPEKRDDTVTMRFLAERSQNSVRRYDVFLVWILFYKSWISIDIIKKPKEFFKKTSEDWKKLLAGKNICYRLLALYYAEDFLEPKELIKVYENGLSEPDDIFKAISIEGLGELGTKEAKKLLINYVKKKANDGTWREGQSMTEFAKEVLGGDDPLDEEALDEEEVDGNANNDGWGDEEEVDEEELDENAINDGWGD